MKRTPFAKLSGAELGAALERQREKQAASAARYQKRRGKRSPLPARNPERLAKRRAVEFGPPGFVDWVHSLPCSVPECGSTPIEAAHATSRGAGGTWEDVLPLCTKHHAAQHAKGIRTFERHVGFDLATVAAAVHQRWMER